MFTMLASSSAQYYNHHDYLQPLQPLPTGMDSKKSPLAMLAQTCNSIGKDPTPPKSVSTDKKDGEESRSNSSTSSKPADDKTSKSAPDHRTSPSSTTRSSFRTPPLKDSGSSSQGGQERPRRSPGTSDDKSSSSSERDAGYRSSNHVAASSPGPVATSSTPSSSSSSSGGLYSNSKISLSCGNVTLEVNHREGAAANALTAKPRSSLSTNVTTSDSLTTPVSALPPGFGSYPSGLPLFGHPLSMDPASSLYHAGLSAHSLAAAAHKGGLTGAGGTSPYVSYATVRTTTGATTLVPVCKDPYCAHCQMTMRSAQVAGASTCAAGCAQCSHDKTCANLASSLSQSVGSYGGLSLLSTPSLPPAHSSLYPHMFSVLPGQHSLPYVCNWVAGGSEHCGKRYATSEELLQHLRTHTSSGELSLTSLAAPSALSYGSLALSNPALACHPIYSNPAFASPSSALRQAYPRSLSPTSLLTASRYHPYKSALSSLPSPAAFGISPSSLGAYYSPYSLYGQRIGAGAGP